MWKEAARAYFMAYSGIFVAGLRKFMKIPFG
jgi:hypothetical protein